MLGARGKMIGLSEIMTDGVGLKKQNVSLSCVYVYLCLFHTPFVSLPRSLTHKHFLPPSLPPPKTRCQEISLLVSIDFPNIFFNGCAPPPPERSSPIFNM